MMMPLLASMTKPDAEQMSKRPIAY